jgi:hypothetical protein
MSVLVTEYVACIFLVHVFRSEPGNETKAMTTFVMCIALQMLLEWLNEEK